MQEKLYLKLIKMEKMMKREFETRDELMRKMEEEISKLKAK